MRVESVHLTQRPLRNEVLKLLPTPEVVVPGVNKTPDSIGGNRFKKDPDLVTLIKKPNSATADAAKNPNIMRRSGCRCIDKNDPEPTLPPCKSRFCEKKRAKTQFGKTGGSKDRALRKGALVELPGKSGMRSIGKPSIERAERPAKRAA
jgi:hypothetical protein